MNGLLQDFRFARRHLGKRPGFTLIMVGTLALGIGCNTLIFSLVSGVVLQPLPFQEPQNLVQVQTHWTDKVDGHLSAPEFLTLREQTTTLEHLAVYVKFETNLLDEGDPQRLAAVASSADLFPALGLGLAHGRAFTPQEDLPNAENVVVVSHELWERSLGANPRRIGSTLNLGGKTATLVGVLQPETRLPEDLRAGSRTDIWFPLGLEPAIDSYPNGNHFLDGVARLQRGVSLEKAQGEIDLITKRMREERGFERSLATFGVDLLPLHGQVVRDFSSALLILLAAVGLILLLACANVANLLMARATSRHQEFTVRVALGASRKRLLRQLLTESLLLASLGAGLGYLLAAWGLSLVQSLHRANLPRLAEVQLDSRTLLFTLALTTATSIVFGLIPAWQTTGFSTQNSTRGRGKTKRLKSSLRASQQGPNHHRRRTSRLLVVSQVAMAVVLVISAGLLVKNLWQLQRTDAGFDTQNLLTFQLSLPRTNFPSDPDVTGFMERLRLHLEGLPGVEHAGAITGLPLASSRGDWNFYIEGRPLEDGELVPQGDWQVATPGYFEAMKVRLISGRWFSPSDDSSAPLSVIVNEALAQRYWPGTSPIGQRIRLGGNDDNPFSTIIGVAGNIRHRSLQATPREEIYLAHSQWPAASSRSAISTMSFSIRTTSDPTALTSSVRRLVASLDPDLPLANIQTYEAIRSDSLAPQRFAMGLFAFFAAVALALSSIGILGILLFQVAQQMREIGIRLALGAKPEEILRRVVGQGLALSTAGLAIGLAGAWVLTRWMGSLLAGVSAQDPFIFGLVPLVLLAAAFLASYLPAQRAANVDPLESLRHE
ncbi:MAG: ABC transporter permease [Deltaproteobacteria bacterium]|nr:ABC transporter permease [Deltaproteobacteria bacterium]